MGFHVIGEQYVMFKKQAAVFYQSIKTRGVAACFYSDKTHAASFLNGFKNIPKSVSLGSPNKGSNCEGKYQHTRKTSYALLVFFI